MLLNGGKLGGRRYLSAAAMELLSTPQAGELPAGFFQSDTFGRHGLKYGWGIGTCVARAPHEGVAAMLSPGTYGHGGAWGTLLLAPSPLSLSLAESMSALRISTHSTLRKEMLGVVLGFLHPRVVLVT